jgi:Fe2+ transport system protein FeoA
LQPEAYSPYTEIRPFWSHFQIAAFSAAASGVRQVSALSELRVGERGILVALDLPESVQNHLMHMGFVPDACVHALRRAPAGDPTVFCIDGMEIALRHETAAAIRVRPCTAATASTAPTEEAPEIAEAAR